ncbi:MAG: hypothetical protein Q9201_006558 [Fulgogasparrea decipioides]
MDQSRYYVTNPFTAATDFITQFSSVQIDFFSCGCLWKRHDDGEIIENTIRPTDSIYIGITGVTRNIHGKFHSSFTVQPVPMNQYYLCSLKVTVTVDNSVPLEASFAMELEAPIELHKLYRNLVEQIGKHAPEYGADSLDPSEARWLLNGPLGEGNLRAADAIDNVWANLRLTSEQPVSPSHDLFLPG